MARQRKLPDGMRMRGKTFYAWFQWKGISVQKRLSKDFDQACDMLKEEFVQVTKRANGTLDNNCSWEVVKDDFLAWAKQATRMGSEFERDLKQFEAFHAIKNVNQFNPAFITKYREWRLAQPIKTNRKPKPPKISKRKLKGGLPAAIEPAASEPSALRLISPRTVNREVATLRNCLNRAVGVRIGSNPIAGVDPLPHDLLCKERRALTLEEVDRLFEVSPAYLRTVWRTFLTTGMRLQEVVNLKFSDIDFKQKTATVRPEVAKNHKAREIQLDAEVFASIQQLEQLARDRRPMPGKTAATTAQQLERFSREHVFVTNANTPWRNNLLTRFYMCCRRAEIGDAVPRGSIDIHSLRVSAATFMLEHGANPKDVQEILGHSTLDLTMNIYAKATLRGKRAAVSAIPFAKAAEPEQLRVISLRNSDKSLTSKNSTSQDQVAKAVTRVS